MNVRYFGSQGIGVAGDLQSSDQSGPNVGTIVGAVIGSIAGCLIISACVVIIIIVAYRLKQRKIPVGKKQSVINEAEQNIVQNNSEPQEHVLQDYNSVYLTVTAEQTEKLETGLINVQESGAEATQVENEVLEINDEINLGHVEINTNVEETPENAELTDEQQATEQQITEQVAQIEDNTNNIEV
jgi:hypothetical protein